MFLAPSHPGSQRAFSLLELMVSLAVLAVLVVFMGTMLSHTGVIWSHGAASSERLQNVRAINEAIGNELRAALLPVNRMPSRVGYTSTPVMLGLQFVVNPSNPSAARPYPTAANPYGPEISAIYKHPDAVFWQAPCASDQTLGEVAELGYFIRWDTTAHPDNPRAMLCRFAVNPLANGTAANPALNPNFLIYSPKTTWLSDSIVEAVAPATAAPPAPAQPYEGLFAENVIGLWVRCLDSYDQPITADFFGVPFASHGFDSRLGYTDSMRAQSPSYTDSAGKPAPLYVLPPAVEISLVMIDTRTANLITPEIQSAIASVESGMTADPKNGSSVNGTSFVTQALRGVPADPAATPEITQQFKLLKRIAPSMRAYETKVFLQNSK